MKHKQPDLPYRFDALEPHVSSETLQYHYKKHHAGYIKKLNDLVKGTALEGKTLEELIRSESNGNVFNNAAQAWNHTFYWNSMTPNRDNKPSKKLESAIRKSFGSIRQFKH